MTGETSIFGTALAASDGGKAANEKLSTERAQAVEVYLTSSNDNAKEKISVTGYGLDRLVAYCAPGLTARCGVRFASAPTCLIFLRLSALHVRRINVNRDVEIAQIAHYQCLHFRPIEASHSRRKFGYR